MMRSSDVVLLLAGTAFILAATAAYAEEPCMPVSAAVMGAESLGGHMIDLIDIPGQNAEQLLIAVADGAVQVWGVKDGCMVGVPVPLDTLKSKGLPA